MAISLPELTVVAATGLEARAVTRALPGARVVETGIGLAKLADRDLGDIVVSCGLAGGLRTDVATGAIVVPESVTAPDGSILTCDEELRAALVRAARQTSSAVEGGPLITTRALVTGPMRGILAERGYVAADMETGLIRASRLAAVRVVLDTPMHELSPAWLHPLRALVTPAAWSQTLWLAREGPRCAQLAAQVLATAVGS